MIEKPLEDLSKDPGKLDRRRVVQRRPGLLSLVLEGGRGEPGDHLAPNFKNKKCLKAQMTSSMSNI